MRRVKETLEQMLTYGEFCFVVRTVRIPGTEYCSTIATYA